jgi:hypothetical protein
MRFRQMGTSAKDLDAIARPGRDSGPKEIGVFGPYGTAERQRNGNDWQSFKSRFTSRCLASFSPLL